MRNRIIAIALVAILLAIFLLKSCTPDNTNTTTPETPATTVEPVVNVPPFNADSAYGYVARQVAFGPRTPDSQGHRACGDWLVATLKRMGADTVIEQKGSVTAFNGQPVPLRNIIASWNPANKERVLLMTHWDTRPYADHDTQRQHEPIDGANDGGSGVGILMEIARQLKAQPPNVGVDIFLTDVEDMGQPQDAMGANDDGSSMKTWCLGSQYWVKNPHVPNYHARFGILLDMVGTADARFPREGLSMRYAPAVVNKVWKAAAAAGYGDRFLSETRAFVGIDDHVAVNEEMGIPVIDIIAWDSATGAFPPSWHTHNDNMSVIDRSTLQAVGNTVARTVWAEK